MLGLSYFRTLLIVTLCVGVTFLFTEVAADSCTMFDSNMGATFDLNDLYRYLSFIIFYMTNQ